MTSRRTAMQTVRLGIAQAGRNLPLVLLVWGMFLLLAWVAALPAWRWWDRVLSLAPEGDRLLHGLNIALVKELSHFDRSPTAAIAMGSAFTFFVFALFLNPFVAGGTLGVLQSSSGRSMVTGVTRRFIDDGVRLYWPFARILLIVGMLGTALTMIAMAGCEELGAAFDERGMARASMWAENVMLLSLAIVFGASSLLVDVARIFMLRRDDGRAAAAIRQALEFIFVRRNAGAVVAIGMTFGVMVGVAVVIYNLIASGITPLTWGLIVFTIVWQQLFAFARTVLRVGLLAALGTLVESRMPRPVAPPIEDLTPADEPVYELPMLG